MPSLHNLCVVQLSLLFCFSNPSPFFFGYLFLKEEWEASSLLHELNEMMVYFMPSKASSCVYYIDPDRVVDSRLFFSLFSLSLVSSTPAPAPVLCFFFIILKQGGGEGRREEVKRLAPHYE